MCALLRELYGGVYMSVIEFGTGDLFVIRTIKYLSTNPDNKWANSYEVVSSGATGSGELLTLGSAIVLFEQTMSLSQVRFDHMIISTWAADSKPYNPATFMSVPLTGGGAAPAATDALPLSQCLSVARVADSGRFGHVFYRGWLKEGDVSAPAGKAVLSDPGSLSATVDNAITSSELDGYLSLDGRLNLNLCMISKNGTNVRLIRTLTVQGVSQLPTDHAWFNRRAPTAP